MANEFRLNVTRVLFPLFIDGEDSEGNSVVLFEKRYSIDLGNKEKISMIYETCKELSDKAKEIEGSDAPFDKIEELSKSIIQAALGDWETIWEKTNHDIFAVMNLSFRLAEVVTTEASGKLKRYGL